MSQLECERRHLSLEELEELAWMSMGRYERISKPLESQRRLVRPYDSWKVKDAISD